MRNYFYLLGFLILLFSPSVVHAEHDDALIDPILTSAEDFFIALQERAYETSWELLSEESRERIIEDVYESSRKLLKKATKQSIRESFLNKGVLFNTYWRSFSNNFDPELVLEQSLWEMGEIRRDRAEIIISYKKSDWPARLKMFRENNAWRVGIVESFWQRRVWDWQFYKEFL